jgi:hypothetical protein
LGRAASSGPKRIDALTFVSSIASSIATARYSSASQESDVWITDVDLNNPPADMAPAELLSHYEAAEAQV